MNLSKRGDLLQTRENFWLVLFAQTPIHAIANRNEYTGTRIFSEIGSAWYKKTTGQEYPWIGGSNLALASSTVGGTESALATISVYSLLIFGATENSSMIFIRGLGLTRIWEAKSGEISPRSRSEPSE